MEGRAVQSVRSEGIGKTAGYRDIVLTKIKGGRASWVKRNSRVRENRAPGGGGGTATH